MQPVPGTTTVFDVVVDIKGTEYNAGTFADEKEAAKYAAHVGDDAKVRPFTIFTSAEAKRAYDKWLQAKREATARPCAVCDSFGCCDSRLEHTHTDGCLCKSQ